jgi:hypothetical protein
LTDNLGHRCICVMLEMGLSVKEIAYKVKVTEWMVYKVKKRCPRMSKDKALR